MRRNLWLVIIVTALMCGSIPNSLATKVWHDDIAISFEYNVSFRYDLDTLPQDPHGDFKEVLSEHAGELEEAVQEQLLDKMRERQKRETLTFQAWQFKITTRGLEDEEITVSLSLDVLGSVYEEGNDYHCLVKWRDVNCDREIEIENKYGRTLRVNPGKMLGLRWIEFSNNLHEGWDTEKGDSDFTFNIEHEWSYYGITYSGEQTISVPFTEVVYRDDTVESPGESSSVEDSSDTEETEPPSEKEKGKQQLTTQIVDLSRLHVESVLIGFLAAVTVLFSVQKMRVQISRYACSSYIRS
jgi:hypothetical protein